MPGYQKGNTLSEYGFILALIAVGLFGVLQLLGGNINQSLQLGNTKLTDPTMQNYVSLNFQSGGGSANSQSTNSKPAPNILPLTDSSSAGINATTAEGKTVMATGYAATTIEQLSAQISDPAAQSLTKEIATFLYGVTLSEGFMQGIPSLAQNTITDKDSGYTKLNALRDIYNGIQYTESRIKQLANGPLANDPAVKQVIQLANVAVSKAHNDYPLAEIRRTSLNQNNNADFKLLNQNFFKGTETSNTKQSTVNDLTTTGGNPLPELARTTVKSALANNQLDPDTTTKVTAVAAVTSDNTQ